MTDSQVAEIILDALRQRGHVGRHNAIPRADLLRCLSWRGIDISDRPFRRIYNSDDCAVLVCDGGLFLPLHWYEVEDCIRYLAAHLSGPKLKHRAAVLTLAYRHLMLRDVGPLFDAASQHAEVRA
jgi:hypothetical protein